ncbi:uncharacterized protein G2W53_026488 [Senna tora]|uniref:Uncharacterized protein n=1 Tax=Senna tora TaxID=362788 RepID=A0A834TF64_9FABA|nr:uncharacterized protein G2W53_026488 [Senna tora]
MALCEFDEEIIHEGVDELKTDLAKFQNYSLGRVSGFLPFPIT